MYVYVIEVSHWYFVCYVFELELCSKLVKTSVIGNQKGWIILLIVVLRERVTR